MIPRIFCLTLPEFGERQAQAEKHFAEIGMEVTFVNGIYAQGMGVTSTHAYMEDRQPGDELFYVGFHPTGIFLSHYMLWTALLLQPDEMFMILEIDAIFPMDWREQIEQALKDTPPDFDILFPGSCCTEGRDKVHVAGHVYATSGLMCNHCYIVKKTALPFLLSTNRDCWAPIDVSMMKKSLPHMKSYAVLPRIVEQYNTVLGA